MTEKPYRIARPSRLAALLLGFVLLAALVACAVHGWRTLTQALDGRRARAQEEQVSSFSLKEQMVLEQTHARVRGWSSIVQAQEVWLGAGRGRLYAQVFSAVEGDEDAPWALVLHGGLGTDHTQVQDVACVLSLHGYRVLTPDLYAHGRSEGETASLGIPDAQDVRAWIEWIELEDEGARIVLFGQDEGGVAALLAAADGLPASVRAIATDSAYVSVRAHAQTLLDESATDALGRALFGAAYRLMYGVSLEEGEVAAKIAGLSCPLLVLHGTGDTQVLAWQGEDIAAAAGAHAQLLLIEGASHGAGRYLEPDVYYDALLAFYEDALR